MSENLEDILRRSTRAGRLNHLSIAHRIDGTWEAAYRGTSHADHRIACHADPVAAMISALTGKAAPTKAKRSSPKPKAKTKPTSVLDDML